MPGFAGLVTLAVTLLVTASEAGVAVGAAEVSETDAVAVFLRGFFGDDSADFDVSVQRLLTFLAMLIFLAVAIQGSLVRVRIFAEASSFGNFLFIRL